MSLKQQYQRFLLSNAFFQSQRELHADPALWIEQGYDFSEQDNIQSEWVSYYYVSGLKIEQERKMRKLLIQHHQIQYIQIDHAANHMAIYHNGNVEQINLIVEHAFADIIYQQTLSNYVPVTTTLTPVIQTTQILSWLSSIHLVLFLVTLCIAILASSVSLAAFSVLILTDALVYLIANNAIMIEPELRNRLIQSMAWLEVIIIVGLLYEIFRTYTHPVVPLAGFMVLQASVILVSMVVSRYLIAKDFVSNRYLHWIHLFKNSDVVFAVGLLATGLLVHVTRNFWVDLVSALMIVFIILARIINILWFNKLALK